MLKSIQSYLYIGQSQRKGLAITFLLIISYAVFRHYYIQFNGGTLPEIQVSTEIMPENFGEKRDLDINEISTEQLISIGIDPKIAGRMVNFREKIKGFDSWEQVAKVYGLTDDKLTLLKDRTNLNHQENEKSASNQSKNQNGYKHNYKPVKSEKTLTPAKFDPNTVTLESLQIMGMPEKIARGIVNFRNSGFTYKSPEDLKKIYSMDEKVFTTIRPFIQISGQPTTSSNSKHKITKTINRVDINTASVEDLDQLPGIGSGYANKILNWRNKLGGFHSIDQLASTYNLPDSVFEKIKSYIIFKTPPEKILINQCDETALSKHFYIKSKEAKIIIAYRNNHGPFRNANDLMKIGAVDKQWIEKITPYIEF